MSNKLKPFCNHSQVPVSTQLSRHRLCGSITAIKTCRGKTQWTAFITPVWSAPLKQLAALIFALLVPLTAPAAEFQVRQANITQVGNGYVLNARIDYPLTPRVKEALENGVPITFFQDLELIHSTPILGRFWSWDSTLWSSKIRYELRFHDLSGQYLLTIPAEDEYQNFPTLESALDNIGEIDMLPLPRELMGTPKQLTLRLRSGLDLHALPTPMRPGALISGKWRLTSEWFEASWPLN